MATHVYNTGNQTDLIVLFLLLINSWILSMMFSNSFLISYMVITLNLMRPPPHCVQHSVCQICQYRPLTWWRYTGAMAVCLSFRVSRRVTKHYLWRGLFSATEKMTTSFLEKIITLFFFFRLSHGCPSCLVFFWYNLQSQSTSPSHYEVNRNTKADTMTQTFSQMHAWLHQCT